MSSSRLTYRCLRESQVSWLGVGYELVIGIVTILQNRTLRTSLCSTVIIFQLRTVWSNIICLVLFKLKKLNRNVLVDVAVQFCLLSVSSNIVAFSLCQNGNLFCAETENFAPLYRHLTAPLKVIFGAL